MPELSFAKKSSRERKIQLPSFEFSADLPTLLSSSSGVRLLKSSVSSLSKLWQISVEAALTLQSYSGFRSAPCVTRFTNTVGVADSCPNLTFIE